ncbi:MAG: homoserine kinase [Lapillicoccus sp.]
MPGVPSVRIRVPASTANLGPGFDAVGLALGLWDEYDVTVGDGGEGLRIAVSGEGASEVPLDATHLVARAMAHGFARLGAPMPPAVCLVARNGVPHGRGLGSSAAAIVAGVVAAQVFSRTGDWQDSPAGAPVDVDLDTATDLATELEGHPDNASASVRGGLTVSWTRDPGDPVGSATGTASVPIHPDITAVVLMPQAQLATHTARAVLPPTVEHTAAALNSGRAALLVEALSRRPDLLLAATRDWLHQGFRRAAFAPSMDLVDALRAQGHAAVISGAGPSVVVLTTRAVAGSVATSAPELPAGWQRLEPGVPASGVQVNRR